MTRQFSLAAATAALVVLLVSAGGAAAFWGLTRLVAPAPLSAEVRIDPMVLPSGVSVDPKVVAEYLIRQMTQQAERDVAIRMTLGADNVTKMLEVAFPRLVSTSMITRMFERIPPLKSILSLTEFRSAARVSVVNRSDAPLENVAMTLPGVKVAELPSGEGLEIVMPQRGPEAVRIGTLQPGARLDFAAWLTEPADAAGRAEAIRLGAAGGLAGEVAVYAGEGWLGESLAAQPWARWLVGTVLIAAALSALAVLAVTVIGAGRRSAASRA